MAVKKSSQAPASITMYSYIGNLGCIRFPQQIRKVSGIKRGDRLAVSIQATETILLVKLDVPGWIPTEAISNVSVEDCGCAEPPEACRKSEPDLVTVGWSYVQLHEALAIKLGFLPNTPIKLVGKPSQITVSLHQNPNDLEGVQRVACPP